MNSDDSPYSEKEGVPAQNEKTDRAITNHIDDTPEDYSFNEDEETDSTVT